MSWINWHRSLHIVLSVCCVWMRCWFAQCLPAGLLVIEYTLKRLQSVNFAEQFCSPFRYLYTFLVSCSFSFVQVVFFPRSLPSFSNIHRLLSYKPSTLYLSLSVTDLVIILSVVRTKLLAINISTKHHDDRRRQEHSSFVSNLLRIVLFLVFIVFSFYSTLYVLSSLVLIRALNEHCITVSFSHTPIVVLNIKLNLCVRVHGVFVIVILFCFRYLLLYWMLKICVLFNSIMCSNWECFTSNWFGFHIECLDVHYSISFSWIFSRCTTQSLFHTAQQTHAHTYHHLTLAHSILNKINQID